MSEIVRQILIFFILLPGIIAVLIMASGSYFGREGSFVLTTSGIGLAVLFIGLTYMFWIIPGSLLTYKYFFWIHIGFCAIQWGFLIDSLSCLMLVIVSFISFLVHFYSIGYMRADPHAHRFMAYLSLLTFFMFILVTGDNLLQLFLGWEGVGLCSYLLVSFWYTRINANKAAIKALIINRIGDIALIIAMAIIYHQFKTLNYAIIFSICQYFENITTVYFHYNLDILSLVSACLFFGAVGKSAQLGLHTWLPDAMEGPTPVSALIHAATMVTAGVFLLIRCSPLLEYAPTILIFISLIGALTTFFAASIGIVQTDIKKIIAYSTCSQLGYMVLACGLSSYTLALYHLLTHAFFKALLFLSAGSIIHSVGDEQDYRRMGALVYFLPITYSTMLIGSCAIMGMPYLAGYYSKDLILEANFLHENSLNVFLQPLLIISTMLTIIYSLKLLFQAFLATANGYKAAYLQIHEPQTGSFLIIPLIILACCSIFCGYFFQEIFSVVGNSFFNNVIVIREVSVEMEFFDIDFKLYVFWLTTFLIGWVVFYYIIVNVTARQTFSTIGFLKPLSRISLKFNIAPQHGLYLYSIKVIRKVPLINIWYELYLLKILFLPISIGYKWFAKPIPTIAYKDYLSGKIIQYDRHQVQFVIDRPLWQYKYPNQETNGVFFNLDKQFLLLYLGGLIFLVDFLRILFTKVKQIGHFTMQLRRDFLPILPFYNLYYDWRSYAIIKPKRNEPFFNLAYIVGKVYLTLALRQPFSGLNNMFPSLISFGAIKKTANRPLINIWYELYLLKILFLPISIGYKWFAKPIPTIAYKDYLSGKIIQYDRHQVQFVIDRPLWQYKYPNQETNGVFFNVHGMPTYLFVKKDKDGLAVWYAWLKGKGTTWFISLWYTIFIVLSGVIIKQWYWFYNIIILECLTPRYVYLIDRQEMLPLAIQISRWSLKDWLVVPVEFIFANRVSKKVDFFQSFQLEKIRLEHFVRQKVLQNKIQKDRPLINIWYELYLLKILFLPISIGYKWFAKPIPTIAYKDYLSGKIIQYDRHQVQFVIDRPLWQYKYPNQETNGVFFNVPSRGEVLTKFFFRTIQLIRFLFYCFSQEKYTFLQMILYFTFRHEFSYYFVGVLVINFTFVLCAFYANFTFYYLGTSALILFFLVSNIYSGVIRFFGWFGLHLGFWFLNGFVRIKTVFALLPDLLVFESDYLYHIMRKLMMRSLFYIQTYVFILYALLRTIIVQMNFICTQVNYLRASGVPLIYVSLIKFLSKKWFFDIFQNKISYFILSRIYTYVYLLFEKGLFEFFGPTGLIRVTTKISDIVISKHRTKIAFFSSMMFYSCIILYFVICFIF